MQILEYLPRSLSVINEDADIIEDEAQRTKALNLLEAITVLAIDYEKKHDPMPPLDPIEAIKQRTEMLSLNLFDLLLAQIVL